MNDIPRHVAIILDGNRRFAKKLMLEPWKGHEYGFKKVEELLDWCHEIGIEELTVYAFSLQNFNRPKEEFDFLMKLFLEVTEKFYNDPRIDKHGICIKVIGRYNMFPENIVNNINKIMDKTKNHKNFRLNIAMAYGGREEIVDAVRKLLEKNVDAGSVSEDLIAENLYLNSDPDLIIRTGGEHRTSNFLPWQSIYSELFFTDKTWPELEKQDFLDAIEDFKRRERRFGK